jgi:hypothetical protein
MYISRISALLLTFASPGVAAQSSVPQGAVPQASVRIFDRAGDVAQWYGRGPRVFRANICIGSTTGHYRLQVQRAGTTDMSAAFRFHDATGREQTAPSSASGTVEFVGVDPNLGSCDAGANAWIEVTIDEATMRAAQAGDYLESLSLVAQPI